MVSGQQTGGVFALPQPTRKACRGRGMPIVQCHIIHTRGAGADRAQVVVVVVVVVVAAAAALARRVAVDVPIGKDKELVIVVDSGRPRLLPFFSVDLERNAQDAFATRAECERFGLGG